MVSVGLVGDNKMVGSAGCEGLNGSVIIENITTHDAHG